MKWTHGFTQSFIRFKDEENKHFVKTEIILKRKSLDISSVLRQIKIRRIGSIYRYTFFLDAVLTFRLSDDVDERTAATAAAATDLDEVF